MTIQGNIIFFQLFNNLLKLLSICKRDKKLLLDFRPQDSNVEFRPDNAIVKVHLFALKISFLERNFPLLFRPPIVQHHSVLNNPSLTHPLVHA